MYFLSPPQCDVKPYCYAYLIMLNSLCCDVLSEHVCLRALGCYCEHAQNKRSVSSQTKETMEICRFSPVNITTLVTVITIDCCRNV